MAASFYIPTPLIVEHKVPISPYPHQHSLVLDFLVVAILMGVKWCLIVVLIFICLMASDVVEHLFMCFLTPWISSKKRQFKSFAHIVIGLSVFLVGEL